MTAYIRFGITEYTNAIGEIYPMYCAEIVTSDYRYRDVIKADPEKCKEDAEEVARYSLHCDDVVFENDTTDAMAHYEAMNRAIAAIVPGIEL